MQNWRPKKIYHKRDTVHKKLAEGGLTKCISEKLILNKLAS